MDDKKQESTANPATETTPNNAPVQTSSAPEFVAEEVSVPETSGETLDEVASDLVEVNYEPEMDSEPADSKTKFNLKAYVGAVVVILVIAAGLIFVLEKEGRISTGLFAGVIGNMEAKAPAATVNGTVIYKSEYNSSVQQLSDMAASQGADTSDPAMVEQFKTQAIDTLVNAELLRQTAVAAGMTVTPEEIENRFNEIEEGIGGPEALAARMAEFGVTELSLRRDIENEFLIQGLFDQEVSIESIDVSEGEIKEFYENAGGPEAGLPPLVEVRDQVDQQIRLQKQQELVNIYLEDLKKDADIEILI